MTISARFVLVSALVVLLAFPLAGCNTVEGFGKDAKAAGEALTGAAQSTKGY